MDLIQSGELEEIVGSCATAIHAATLLDIDRKTLREIVLEEGIDNAHWATRMTYPRDEPILGLSKTRRNGVVRKYILDNDLLPYKCSNSKCPNPIPFWGGKNLTLQLDHINGNCLDNRLENLRFLCPNCHTQTETYTGRNRKRK